MTPDDAVVHPLEVNPDDDVDPIQISEVRDTFVKINQRKSAGPDADQY